MFASSRIWTLGSRVVALLLILSASWAHGGGTPKKSQYQNYLNQLKSRFQSWDLNGDKALDKAELAKAFRGPQAKPYDDVPDSDLAKKGKVKPIALALISLPRPGLAVNLTLAELLSKPADAKPKATAADPAVLQYGDFQFLALIGKDDQISKQDYDSWAMGYARNLDRLQEMQKEVKASQDKLARAKTAKQVQTANNDLAKHQSDLAAVSAQLSGVSPAIQAALNVKK
jgi:hypothetical protein